MPEVPEHARKGRLVSAEGCVYNNDAPGQESAEAATASAFSNMNRRTTEASFPPTGLNEPSGTDLPPVRWLVRRRLPETGSPLVRSARAMQDATLGASEIE